VNDPLPNRFYFAGKRQLWNTDVNASNCGLFSHISVIFSCHMAVENDEKQLKLKPLYRHGILSDRFRHMHKMFLYKSMRRLLSYTNENSDISLIKCNKNVRNLYVARWRAGRLHDPSSCPSSFSQTLKYECIFAVSPFVCSYNIDHCLRGNK